MANVEIKKVYDITKEDLQAIRPKNLRRGVRREDLIKEGKMSNKKDMGKMIEEARAEIANIRAMFDNSEEVARAKAEARARANDCMYEAEKEDKEVERERRLQALAMNDPILKRAMAKDDVEKKEEAKEEEDDNMKEEKFVDDEKIERAMSGEEVILLRNDAIELKNSLLQAKQVVKEVFGEDDPVMVEKLGVTLFIQEQEREKTDKMMKVLYNIAGELFQRNQREEAKIDRIKRIEEVQMMREEERTDRLVQAIDHLKDAMYSQRGH
jgi:hypothetical protein